MSSFWQRRRLGVGMILVVGFSPLSAGGAAAAAPCGQGNAASDGAAGAAVARAHATGAPVSCGGDPTGTGIVWGT